LIGIDTNILVYAHRKDSPYHEVARRCLLELAEGSRVWVIPWPCIHEFLAVITDKRLYDPPTPLPIAIEQIEAWIESPTVTFISESELYWTELKRILLTGRISKGVVHDAHIAALCLEHGVREFLSADRDFSRFPELAIVNPLRS
jgi:uncharacterized protein